MGHVCFTMPWASYYSDMVLNAHFVIFMSSRKLDSDDDIQKIFSRNFQDIEYHFQT